MVVDTSVWGLRVAVGLEVSDFIPHAGSVIICESDTSHNQYQTNILKQLHLDLFIKGEYTQLEVY